MAKVWNSSLIDFNSNVNYVGCEIYFTFQFTYASKESIIKLVKIFY